MDQGSGDGRFSGQIKNLRDRFQERIFPILTCWTRILLLFWIRSSRTPTSRSRSVSRIRKPRKRIGFYEEDRSSSRSTTTFEWLALMIQYWIMLIYSLSLFMMIIFRNSIQDGTKNYFQWQRFHPMIFWKVCTNWEYVSPRNSKPYWNFTTWRFIRIFRCQLSEVENDGEEKYRSETSITKLRRQTWENWIWGSGQESEGTDRRWRRKRYLLPVERKKAVFERRPMQFRALEQRSCAKTRTLCRHAFWANCSTRTKCVEEEKHRRQK